jgi:hypothetical protein
MLDTHTDVVHREVYRFGTVQYSLLAAKTEGGYFGRWTCGACEGAGGSSVKDDSVGMAMLSAQASLVEHHRAKHGGDGAPLPAA